MSKILILALLICSFSAFAEKVSFGVDDLSGEIYSQDFKPENVQVVMRCLFEKDGNLTRFSEKRPYTLLSVREESAGHFVSKISMKGTRILDWLPNYNLRACSFMMIVMGHETRTNKLLLTDLYQLGDLWGPMTKQDLSVLQDKKVATEMIMKKWNPIKLHVDFSGERPELKESK